MKVEDLILQLQDVISAAKSMPFSGGKVMVSSDEIYDILDQIQDAMPAEVRQAKNIVADRKQILAEANRESENIIRSAEERKKAMLNQNELVREAQAKAKEIVDDAKQKSAEIRKAANVYVDSIMKRTEEGVATQLEALRKTHANIVSSQKSRADLNLAYKGQTQYEPVLFYAALSYVLCHIMTLKRMLAESAVEKYKNVVGFCNPCGAFCNF